jgi:hypothetical protein
MRNLLSDLGKEKHRWSGQILDPIDYCGFIGRTHGSQFSPDGIALNGLAFSALAEVEE